MKKVFAAVIIFMIIVGFSTLGYAGSGPEEYAGAARKNASVKAMPGDKAARGIENILFGWTEIPKRIVDTMKETGNPVWSLGAGTVQGTLKAFARTASGVSDVATAPWSPEKAPFINPDINLE